MEVSEYLSEFRSRHSLAEIVGWLDRISKLHPVVIGETIIDNYIFCEALGKSSKDPILSVLKKSSEKYAGGALAISNHLGGLCNNPNRMQDSDAVHLVTQLGEIDRREEFVRGALRSNVMPYFLTKQGAPTISKTRLIDQYSNAKLIEIYEMSDEPSVETLHLKEILASLLPECDLILSADFGHGFITEKVVRQLWASGIFLCVMAQSNSGNRGFNSISKYQRADYVCIANHEADLETRQRGGDDRDKLVEITRRVACPRWTVTRGSYGSLHYNMPEGEFTEAPALANKIVDRVGAGDSVFAVTSLLARVGAPWDILAFVGNVTGAIAVECLGNAKSIDRKTLEERICQILKPSA